MIKWFQQRTRSTQETENKRRMSRKERYIRRYLNIDKVISLLGDLTAEQLPFKPEPTIYHSSSIPLERQIDIKNLQLTVQSLEAFAFDHETQRKIIDMVIPESDHCLKSPILAVFSVFFHHKRGSSIEFQYPANQEEYFESPKEYEDVINRITTYALPDAVHNLNEDYMYFTLQTKLKSLGRRLLFGVTYFKQIKVTPAMKEQDPELTRSHIQKAICMVSLEPLFGYMKKRLEPTIRAYFSLEVFSDMSLVQFAYQNIEQALDYQSSFKKLEIAEIYAGTNLKALFFNFKEKVFKILKAIMLEMRIIVFSLSSSTCSDFLVSLLSLLPGMLFFNMNTKMIAQMKNYLTEFGLPFQIFNDKIPFYMYFTVNDLPEIIDQKPLPKGYLIGTTNKFIKSHNKLQPDIVIDIDTETLIINNEQHKKILNTKFCDKQLYDLIFDTSLKNLDVTAKEHLKNFRPIEADINYLGSEDWIRTQVHKQYQFMLSEMCYLYRNLIEFDREITKVSAIQTRKSILIKSETLKPTDDSDSSGDETEQPQNPQHIPNLEFLINKSKEELIKDHRIKELRNRINESFKNIRKINRKFAFQWLCKTSSGQQWKNSHSLSLTLNAKSYEDEYKDLIFVISQKNGDVYIGPASKGQKQQRIGAQFEITKNKVYVGEFVNGNKQGKGRYETLLSKEWTYQGEFAKNFMSGHGRLVVQGQYVYSGYFENDKFNGFGNLQFKDSVYEGQFIEGLYHGTGKLIMTNQDVYVGYFNQGQFEGEGQYVWKQGDIYQGMWKQGLRHGMGRIQKDEEIYEGEWEFGKRSGYGCLTRLESNLKYQGHFIDDNLNVNEMVIVKYPNDSVYQGMISDWLPNGKGYMAFKDGSSQEGHFEGGVLK